MTQRVRCDRSAGWKIKRGVSESIVCDGHIGDARVRGRSDGVFPHPPGDKCDYEIHTPGEIFYSAFIAKYRRDEDIAAVTGIPLERVIKIQSGKERFTILEAIKLGEAWIVNPLALLKAQAEYDLWLFEQANPGVADEVRERVEQLSQESE